MSTLQKVIGYIGLFFSTFAFSGMILWLFNKRGKGGGTMGSIVIGLFLLLLYQYHLQFHHLLTAVIISLIIGIPAVYIGEKFMLNTWGPAKRHTGKIVTEDFNETCIDEVHGMLIAVLPVYLCDFTFAKFFLLHLIAFFAFRFFDGKKIGPVGTIEKAKSLPSPVAVMLDDSIAGILAMVITGLVVMFIQIL